ncbi:MAG TPA: nitrogen fixation protein NifH, partial [Candidatus Atribacteria bacterium]|nr:nitrogen fixation protein NifH [Candidatus Atribacteria bacterium]
MKTKWQEKLNGNPIPWLLESNPWTKYKVLTELLNKPDSSSEV